MVFTVFTGSVELAFRSHCDFEGLVEQSMVFTVFRKTNYRTPVLRRLMAPVKAYKAQFEEVKQL